MNLTSINFSNPQSPPRPLPKNFPILNRVLYIKVGPCFHVNSSIIKIRVMIVLGHLIAFFTLNTLYRVQPTSLLTFGSGNNRKVLGIIKTIVIPCSTYRTLNNFSITVNVWLFHYIFPSISIKIDDIIDLHKDSKTCG